MKQFRTVSVPVPVPVPVPVTVTDPVTCLVCSVNSQATDMVYFHPDISTPESALR